MPNLAKKFIRTVIRKAGYTIDRVRALPKLAPSTAFDLTNLVEYRCATESIPGMVSQDASEILYALCVTQNIEGDVLEIGSWQGKSTSYLGRAVKDSGNGHLFAVDHFRGNIGKEDAYRVGRADLGDLRELFEKNMHRLGLDPYVTTIAQSSKDAYPHLEEKKIRFLFIDGDHTESGVQQDIDLFCPLVRPDGLVVFDDFDATFPGLVRAVERWILLKRPQVVFSRGNMLVCRVGNAGMVSVR